MRSFSTAAAANPPTTLRTTPVIAPARPIRHASATTMPCTRPRDRPMARSTAIWRRRSAMLLYSASRMLMPLDTSTATPRAMKMPSTLPTMPRRRSICCAGCATTMAGSRRSASNCCCMAALPSLPGRVGSRSRMPVILRSASVRSATVGLPSMPARSRRSKACSSQLLSRSVNTARSWAEPVGCRMPTTVYGNSVCSWPCSLPAPWVN